MGSDARAGERSVAASSSAASAKSATPSTIRNSTYNAIGQ